MLAFALFLITSLAPAQHVGDFQVADYPTHTILANAPPGSSLTLSCSPQSPSTILFTIDGEERELPPGNSFTIARMCGDVTARSLGEEPAVGAYELTPARAKERSSATWRTTAEHGATLWETDTGRELTLTVSVEKNQATVTVEVWRGPHRLESFEASADRDTTHHFEAASRVTVRAAESAGHWTYNFHEPARRAD